MYQRPNRPTHDITQPFNSGIVKIYALTNIAAPGYAPRMALKEKVTLRYEEMRLGINRYYQAMQNNIQIERVIRCPRWGDVTNQDVAITEDGKQYRIDLLQSVDDVYPACIDVSLTKIEQVFEVAENDVV